MVLLPRVSCLQTLIQDKGYCHDDVDTVDERWQMTEEVLLRHDSHGALATHWSIQEHTTLPTATYTVIMPPTSRFVTSVQPLFTSAGH